MLIGFIGLVSRHWFQDRTSREFIQFTSQTQKRKTGHQDQQWSSLLCAATSSSSLTSCCSSCGLEKDDRADDMCQVCQLRAADVVANLLPAALQPCNFWKWKAVVSRSVRCEVIRRSMLLPQCRQLCGNLVSLLINSHQWALTISPLREKLFVVKLKYKTNGVRWYRKQWSFLWV